MSGGGQTTQTTKNALPAWAVPYAQGLLGMGSQLYAPGGQPGQMPANMNQQVAGMTPDQIAAMNMIESRAGVMPNAGSQPGITTSSPALQQAAIPGTAAQIPNPPVQANPPLPPPVTPTPPPGKAKKKKK